MSPSIMSPIHLISISMVEITSENSPLVVDFIPSVKDIINGGLLGMTHAPGMFILCFSYSWFVKSPFSNEL